MAGREQGVRETQQERWERLEAYHRNFLGDIAAHENELVEARFQYEKALKLVPETDARRIASLEYSLAALEARDHNPARAIDWATKAREHFMKIGMKKELEDAERLLLGLRMAVPPALKTLSPTL